MCHHCEDLRNVLVSLCNIKDVMTHQRIDNESLDSYLLILKIKVNERMMSPKILRDTHP
jgi:hypothetical protein